MIFILRQPCRKNSSSRTSTNNDRVVSIRHAETPLDGRLLSGLYAVERCVSGCALRNATTPIDSGDRNAFTPLIPPFAKGEGAKAINGKLACQSPSPMKAATRSPITIDVTFVLARMQSGMIDASTTLRFWRPRTLPNWSTTAIGSDSGPILHVPET